MAREAEDEEAAATTTCWISLTSRVAGLVRRSLVNAVRGQLVPLSGSTRGCYILVAIPPVAKMPQRHWKGLVEAMVIDAELRGSFVDLRCAKDWSCNDTFGQIVPAMDF